MSNTSPNTTTLIDDIFTNLVRICKDSEQDFLDLGSHLKENAQDSDAAITKVNMILSLAESDLGKDILNKLNNLNSLSHDFLAGQQVSISEKSRQLNSLTGHLHRLQHQNTRIEQLAKYLRAVALNIFIETSRSNTCSENFSIIASEIKSLSENILSLAKHVRANVVDSEKKLFSMDQEVSEGVRRLDQISSVARKSFATAIDHACVWLTKVKQLAEKNAMVHHDVKQKVGNVVMSLQFQDAMRQRLEHILDSLSDMRNTHETLDENDDAPASLYACSSLLAEQLHGLVTETSDIYQTCSQAFESINCQITSVEEDVTEILYTVSASNKVAGRSDCSKPQLSDSFMEFQAVEHSTKELIGQMKTVFGMASETSSSLKIQVGQIHQISMDAHIKALNAIIAATHLGVEGKTMSVLAGEMKNLSDRIDTFVLVVNDILKDLVKESLIDGQETLNHENYGKTLEEMASKIPRLMNDQLSHFNDLRHHVEGIKNRNKAIRNLVTFIPDLAQGLESQKEALEKLKSLWEPYRKSGKDAEVFGAMMEDRYTMDRERRIHVQSFDTRGKPSAQPDEAEEEPGDNIELF